MLPLAEPRNADAANAQRQAAAATNAPVTNQEKPASAEAKG
jgi:hypothetical protein